ncbi:MAG: hypothetical protein Q9165_005983 [Trypethelium subeluteriae]
MTTPSTTVNSNSAVSHSSSGINSTSSTALNASSCEYTVTSYSEFAMNSDTIQPTVTTECVCGGTEIAEVIKVTGSSGSQYLVCDVSSTSDGITVSTLPPDHPDPTSLSCPDTAAASNGAVPTNYKCKVCNDQTVLSDPDSQDPTAVWDAADANDALVESLQWYNQARWGVDDTCQEYAPDPATMGSSDNPCNYLITNSFINFRNLWKNQYESLEMTSNEAFSEMSNIIKDVFDGFSFAFPMFTSITWNTVLKEAPLFGDEAQSDITRGMNPHYRARFSPMRDVCLSPEKDLLNNMATLGVSTARDQMSA